MASKHIIRRVFVTVSIAATPFGAGWSIASSHPLPGLLLMVVSVLYLMYEAISSPWVQKQIPRMFQFLFGVLISCALIGACYEPLNNYIASKRLAEDVEPQFKILNLSKEEWDQLSKAEGKVYKAKADLLENEAYYKDRKARESFLNLLDQDENKCKCLLLIDGNSVTSQLRPPKIIKNSDAEIDVSSLIVADDLSHNNFWLIDSISKLRIPIVIFVSIKNTSQNPIKIDLLSLQARSVEGWTDIRMSGFLLGHSINMDNNPLVFLGKNAAVSMIGDYLIPKLYDRILQPNAIVEGWIIAEYPRGFKDKKSFGDFRFSLHSQNRWISSITINFQKSFVNDPHGKLYLGTSMDTLITEDR